MSKSFNKQLADMQASLGAAVSMGKVRNMGGAVKFFNAEASASVEDFWSEGGTLSYLSAAELLSIVSTSTDDADQGTGAWRVKIIGLDADWKIAYETITLTGTTPVVTETAFVRVWRMKVVDAGTIAGAVGKITATAAEAESVQASISIGINQSLMSHFTPPVTHSALIFAATISVGSGKEVHVNVETRDNNIANSVFQVKRAFDIFESSLRLEMTVPRLIPSKVDYKWTMVGSAAVVPVSGDYDLILLDNGLINLEEALPLQYELV